MLTEDSALRSATDARAKLVPAIEKAWGISTVGELLDVVPRRYLRPGELTDLRSLQDGEEVVVWARVKQAGGFQARTGRHIFKAVITDGTADLELTFFGGTTPKAKAYLAYLGRLLQVGVEGVFSGTVETFNRTRQLSHPDFEVVGESEDGEAIARDRADHAVPVYPSSKGVTSKNVRTLISHCLDLLVRLREPVPGDVRERRALLGRAETLRLIHRPGLEDDTDPAWHRLRYEEAFVLQTILAQRRAVDAARSATPRRPRPGGLLAAFDARLPWELTDGQRTIGETIAAELASEHPMHRLLQGEVGSGKTVVALRAMLAAVDAGGQAALLAPTEVLAAQHLRSVTSMLGDLAEGGMLGGSEIGTKVVLLTGSMSASARRAALNDIVTGEAGIVIGTHALIQRHVTFNDLALVVVDEQHRFGVEQRDALREKAATPPHLLVMTATPIPRSVAMTVFGDMETSTLRELPAGRAPISTVVVDTTKPRWVERTWERVAEEVHAGHQAYVVCPRIGGDEQPDADGAAAWADGDGRSADDEAAADEAADDDASGREGEATGPERRLAGVLEQVEALRALPVLAGLRIEMLHGQLPAEEKDRVMRAFAAGEVDVLVATTVIEVGVDVANATVMVIEDADRFGIAQLHQLRGRVGRGGLPGLCLLMTPLPEGRSRERLDAVAETTDGFALSRKDLQLRREGDILGARQSGRASSVRFLRMGNEGDEQLIADAREDASAIVAQDPWLDAHPDLKAVVATRLDEEQAAYLQRG